MNVRALDLTKTSSRAAKQPIPYRSTDRPSGILENVSHSALRLRRSSIARSPQLTNRQTAMDAPAPPPLDVPTRMPLLRQITRPLLRKTPLRSQIPALILVEPFLPLLTRFLV